MIETASIKVSLTREELELVQGFLKARQIYIPYQEKWGHQFWEPYMNNLLHKVEAALDGLDG